MCRPRHLCSTAGLYNAVLSHILRLFNKRITASESLVIALHIATWLILPLIAQPYTRVLFKNSTWKNKSNTCSTSTFWAWFWSSNVKTHIKKKYGLSHSTQASWDINKCNVISNRVSFGCGWWSAVSVKESVSKALSPDPINHSANKASCTATKHQRARGNTLCWKLDFNRTP